MPRDDTTSPPDPARLTQAAGYAAQGTAHAIAAMQTLGLPLDAIVSGVLGQALRTFAADQGWEETARLCDELARQARVLAQPGSEALARAEAAGRA